jgi:hypothetical protein
MAFHALPPNRKFAVSPLSISCLPFHHKSFFFPLRFLCVSFAPLRLCVFAVKVWLP